MIISLKWLKEVINTKLDKDDLVKELTNLGLECSDSTIGPSFSGVVIGRIDSLEKHANSDHLSICSVDIGDDSNLQIICGAPNVKHGINVPVAIVGATLSNGEFKIKKTKIRGEVSQGMICSEKELNLSNNHDGIMILDEGCKIGTPFEEFIGLEKDILIDFDLTPNRGDCLSFLGIAREVAILESLHHSDLTKSVIDANTYNIPENKDSIENFISVNIEDYSACPLYVGRIIKDVEIKDSPKWLKDKLGSLGMKSINVIVDLANYVMLTFGQPMHTFDFDKLPNKKINIGYSSSNNVMRTLDSVDRKLSLKNLLIKDGEEPVAIAGVIGGKNTEVDSSTKNIFIESALFDATTIRKSAKSVDLSTDASKRYERSVDPEMVKVAIEILSGLIVEYAGGKSCKGLIQSGKELDGKQGISLNIDECNKFLGTSLKDKDVESILDRVNIKYSKSKNLYTCFAPSYRSHDISRDVDIYEEVARVVGFNNIDNSKSFSVDYRVVSSDRFDLVDSVKDIVSAKGFFEHYSNSLVSDKEHSLVSEYEGIMLSNPLNKNMKYIRSSILLGLLRAVSFNQNRKMKNYKLFEVGATYQSLQKNPPDEDMCLGMIWPGAQFNHWKDSKEYDFFDSKGDIDSFFDYLNLPVHSYSEIDKKGFDVCYAIKVKNLELGYIGIVNSKVLKQSDVRNNIIYAELSIIKLDEILMKKNKFEEPSVYPSVERDISVLVSNQYNAKKLTDAIKKAGGKFLNEVYLFDVYADNSFSKDMKSYAFKMIFQSKSNTLKDSEVDVLIDKIINKLKNNYNIVQR